MENTIFRLEQYSHWLEAYLTERFVRALAFDDRATMVECRKVMAEFSSEVALMKVGYWKVGNEQLGVFLVFQCTL